MQNFKRQLDPSLLAIMNLLGAVSLLGFLYCLIVLLHGESGFNPNAMVLYLVWFAISFISLNMMKHGDAWGVYAMGTATIAIGIYEIAMGTASFGGALLAVFVMLVLISYIKDRNSLIESDNPERVPS